MKHSDINDMNDIDSPPPAAVLSADISSDISADIMQNPQAYGENILAFRLPSAKPPDAQVRVSFPILYLHSQYCEEDEWVRYRLDTLIENEETDRIAAVYQLRPDEPTSLIIRRHAGYNEADAYISALREQGLYDDHDAPIYTHHESYFTLVRRKTEAVWQGPLIIYVAEIAIPERACVALCEMSIAPEGGLHQSNHLKLYDEMTAAD